jgi:hypothetical protein
MRRMLLAIGLVLIASAAAAAEAVDLLLALAIDVSRSVDEEEARLQREGYVRALQDPRVIEAIRSGPNRAIALCYFEWAGENYQHILVDWRRIGDEESAAAFLEELQKVPPVSASCTSISGAIDFAVPLLERAPYAAPRRVVDISGDGRNNHGRAAWLARDEAVARGVVINGLPIVNERPNFGRAPERDLDHFYEQEVIGGAGAFLVLATDFKSFGEAILGKLIKEIAWTPADAARLAAAPARVRR